MTDISEEGKYRTSLGEYNNSGLGKRCGIYEIRNSINNKVYVGSSFNLSSRRYSHVYLLSKGTHYNTHLQKSVNKHGIGAFYFSVLEECVASELISKEQAWSDMFNSNNPTLGYNKREIVESNRGSKRSEESRRKMSAIHFGKKVSIESRIKLSLSHKGHKVTEETKIKISNAQKGRVFSNETREKISKARKGKNFRQGITLKQQTKDKISSANSIPVNQVTLSGILIERYPSASIAHKKTGIHFSAISMACSGKRATAGFFCWEFNHIASRT